MARRISSGTTPEILADDHAGAARALERQHREQLLRGIMHVGALRRRAPGGHPPQTEQRHHVIQAQRAVVAHVVADQTHEALQMLRLHLHRIGRRNAPTLTLERQRIRRRADFGAQAIAPLVGPGLRPRRMGADRIIAVQADGHAELTRKRLRRAQAVRAPATASTR